MKEILLVGSGGIVGSITRFYLGRYVSKNILTGFPLATLIINITGAFMLAFLSFYHPLKISNHYLLVKNLLFTGFLGAYTTFSTFSYESYQLYMDKQYRSLLLYTLGTLILGLISAYFGMYLGTIAG